MISSTTCADARAETKVKTVRVTRSFFIGIGAATLPGSRADWVFRPMPLFYSNGVHSTVVGRDHPQRSWLAIRRFESEQGPFGRHRAHVFRQILKPHRAPRNRGCSPY